MNTGRFVLAVLISFAVIYGYDYVVHGRLMMEQYQATASMWRPMTEDFMMIMVLSEFLYAIMFVFIFTRNYEGLGIAEGLRYGLYIGLLIATLDLGAYAYLPVPLTLVMSWMGASIVKGLVAGAVTALVYRR